MKIPKPTEEDKAFFRALVPDAPGVEIKPMFGNLAAFVNGNMFMGLFGPDVGVRVNPEDRANLESVPGTGPFGPPDRPMKEYVTLPGVWRETPAEAQPWVEGALAYVATITPKQKKR